MAPKRSRWQSSSCKTGWTHTQCTHRSGKPIQGLNRRNLTNLLPFIPKQEHLNNALSPSHRYIQAAYTVLSRLCSHTLAVLIVSRSHKQTTPDRQKYFVLSTWALHLQQKSTGKHILFPNGCAARWELSLLKLLCTKTSLVTCPTSKLIVVCSMCWFRKYNNNTWSCCLTFQFVAYFRKLTATSFHNGHKQVKYACSLTVTEHTGVACSPSEETVSDSVHHAVWSEGSEDYIRGWSSRRDRQEI